MKRAWHNAWHSEHAGYMLALRIILIISHLEKVRVKCNKISEALERRIGMSSHYWKHLPHIRVLVKGSVLWIVEKANTCHVDSLSERRFESSLLHFQSSSMLTCLRKQ